MKNKITSKWKTTGLLDSLKLSQEYKCALMLENITNYIFSKAPKKPTKKSEFIAATLIPITRRLYDGGIKNIDCHFLYDEYEKFLKNKPKLGKSVSDKEAELCCIFSNRIIEQSKCS